MRTVFGDTSLYVAALNPDDVCHGAATAWSRDKSLVVVVTEFVLLELGNLVSRLRQRVVLRSLIEGLRDDPYTVIVPLSTALLDAGLAVYSRRPDKEWSLTDCISFVVMEQRGITEALTTDPHFEQAGFKALLK